MDLFKASDLTLEFVDIGGSTEPGSVSGLLAEHLR
jgi:hypothetical protein